MNELKQIRTMAEMILEKVDALEGAQPYTKDIGFDHLAREYEAKPKFKVGDSVCTTVGEAGKITGIHKLDGHYRYRYLVLFDNGDHHHVVEPLLELSKPDPKFKVGDRVVGDMSSPMIGTIIKLGIKEDWFTVLWSDGLCNSVHTSRLRLATEDDREWHSGPPPHIGWWNASTGKHPRLWRWWNGSSWSQYAHSDDDAKWAHGQAMWVTTDTNIQWTDYWPENARVPRINPKDVK